MIELSNGKHKLVPGDCVEVEEQCFLGNVITEKGVGTVSSIINQPYGKSTRVIVNVNVDGYDKERQYFPRDVRYMGSNINH